MATEIDKKYCKELKKLAKQTKSEYVFCDKNGNPFKDIKTGFLAAMRRAGIKDFRFHDLRHTFGSQLVMQGVGLRIVQQIMGDRKSVV